MKIITSFFSKLVVGTALTIVTFQTVKAQTFPFLEDFNSTPDSTLPSGWTAVQDYGMSVPTPSPYNPYITVYSNQGVSNSKAAVLGLFSTAAVRDSLFTPLIGPITANTIFNVDYKFVQENGSWGGTMFPTNVGPYSAGSFNYPYFTEPVPWIGTFKIVIINTANNNQTTIFQIDSTNHTPSLAYSQQTFNLGSFAGQNIKIAFIFSGISSEFSPAGISEIWLDDISVNDFTTTGVNELQKENTNVFPNPTQDELTISSNETVEVTIYDITGRSVHTENISEAQHTIHLANQQAGIYTVAVRGTHTNKTFRVVKQ